jgi:hypothetical protein
MTIDQHGHPKPGDWHIPPILRGARLVGIKRAGKFTQMWFLPENPNVTGDGYVRIELHFAGKPRFIYTLFDRDTMTTIHYEGEHGDPAMDDSEVLAAPTIQQGDDDD